MRLTEDRRADVVFFEVQDDAEEVVRELEKLARGRVVETVNARDAVTRRKYRPGLADLDAVVEVLDLLLENLADLGCLNLHRHPSRHLGTDSVRPRLLFSPRVS